MRVAVISMLGLCLLAYARPALAKDRMQRARVVFADRCGACHSFEEHSNRDLGKGQINLTGLTTRWNDAQIRNWLADPLKVKADTRCEAGLLDATEAKLVLALLHEPRVPSSARPQIPPFAAGPRHHFAPPPRAGQGDHR
jgi:cytochrome c2